MSLPIVDSANSAATKPAPPTSLGTGDPGAGYAYSAPPPAPPPDGGSLQTALGYYSGQAEPQSNYLDTQDALTRLRQGAIGGQYGTGTNALQQQYGIDLQRLGLNQTQNRIAMGNPQSDIAYWQGMGALGQQIYGHESDYWNHFSDLARQYFGTQSDLIGAARGARGQETDISLADLARAYAHNTFQFGSQQVGHGAYNTYGTKEGFGNLSSQYDLNQQALRNQLLQANIGFDTQYAGAKHEMDSSLLTGTRGQNTALDDLQREILRSTHGEAQGQVQLDLLKSKASEYGLDSQELANKLQTGLQNLHLDQTLKTADLFGALASNDYQRQQVAQQIIAQAVAAAQYMPGGSTLGSNAPVPARGGFRPS